MNTVRNPVLRTLHILYELDQFIKIENIDTNIRYPDVLVKYLGLSIDKEINEIRDFPATFYSKSIAIPADIDDIIVNKARENKTSYNNIIMEYLILGVKNTSVEDRLKSNWINELNQSISELDSIHNIKNLNLELEQLISKKSDLEEEVKSVSEEIDNMRLFIASREVKKENKFKK